jgi:hypothetical protein
MISAHLDIRNPLWVEDLGDDPFTGISATDIIAGGYDGLACHGPSGPAFRILSPDQVLLRFHGPVENSRDPWEITQDAFTGPAIVMDVFEIDGRDENYEHLFEALEEQAEDLPVLARDGTGWEARWLDDWEPPATLGLFDPDGTCQGFYMSGQAWIDEEARGAGRSALMINAAADLMGGSPTQNHGGLGFSEAGYAAHLRAHERLCAARKPAESHAPEM